MLNPAIHLAYSSWDAPLPPALTDELCAFWQETFATSYAGFVSILAGAEEAHHWDRFYLARHGTTLAGTSHLTVSRAAPALAGLGEVATPPAYRQQGIATYLCRLALDDLSHAGGEAVFLGTMNPAAARVYERLGWQRLPGSNVMVAILDVRSPQHFLADLFHPAPVTAIVPGTVAARIPMIPLIVAPHPWQLMDANLPLYSTRWALQRSCMGLYPRYAALTATGSGAWFVAYTGDGRTVGLSSARLEGEGRCQVDGFTHPAFLAHWPALLEAATGWAAAQGAQRILAAVADGDDDKRARFARLGFAATGPGATRTVDERALNTVQLERQD